MSYRAPKSLKKKMLVISLGEDNSFIIYDESSLTPLPTYIHPIQKKNKEKKRKEIHEIVE